MSQLVACRSPRGLLIAADRRVEIRKDDDVAVHTAQKLWSLGPAAAVATSGAAYGIEVSSLLSGMLGDHKTPSFDELERWVLSVFQQRYDEFQSKSASWFTEHPEALRRSYVLLGGESAPESWGLRFFASESHGQPYHPLPVGDVLTAPRRLGLEVRLARAAPESDLEALRDLTVEGLRVIAEHDAGVQGPFDLVLFGQEGTRWETVE